MSSSRPVFTASFITSQARASPWYVSESLLPFCSLSYSNTISGSDKPVVSLYFFHASKESKRKAINLDQYLKFLLSLKESKIIRSSVPKKTAASVRLLQNLLFS